VLIVSKGRVVLGELGPDTFQGHLCIVLFGTRPQLQIMSLVATSGSGLHVWISSGRRMVFLLGLCTHRVDSLCYGQTECRDEAMSPYKDSDALLSLRHFVDMQLREGGMRCRQ
jgi:hypothetical protein